MKLTKKLFILYILLNHGGTSLQYNMMMMINLQVNNVIELSYVLYPSVVHQNYANENNIQQLMLEGH